MATSVASAGPPLAAAPSPAPSAPITLVVSDLAPVTVTTAAPPSAASTPSVASAVSAASAASPTAVPAAVVAAASPGHAHPHPSATPSPRSSLPALAAAASAAHSQGTRSPRPSPTVGPPARPAPQQTSMPPPTLNGHVHQFAVAAQTPPPAAAQHWTIYTAPQQPPPPPQYQPHHHHQQPQQRQRQWSHDSRMSKPAIMDPPGQHLSSSAIQSAGFPSPNIDHARGNSKYIEDVARLTYAIHQSVGQSVRRAIRDNWEKCLLGSDFHQAFIMNATIHRATPSVARRAIRDFGDKMVNVCKEEILHHFATNDIDDMTDIILAKASNRFLDRAMDLRLRTIEAKPLIHALARAERLGYEPGDIVEEDQLHGHERVIPHIPPEQQQHHQHQHPLPPPPPMVSSQPPHPHRFSPPSQPLHPSPPAEPPRSEWQCTQCLRVFQVHSAYSYHTKKQVCIRTPPTPEGFKFSCSYCGQGFTTAVGLQYHDANKVCGSFDAQPGGEKAPELPTMLPLSSQRSSPIAPSVAIMPAAAKPPANAWGTRNRPITIGSAPTHSHSPMASSPPMATATPHHPSTPQPPSASMADPYAHLTPQQRSALDEELKQAEISYGEKMRQAEAILNPADRRTRLDGLRNSFGTKQSMIRKKYGVRLRERRTKAEIEAERLRMGSRGGGRGTPAAGTPSRLSNAGLPTATASSIDPASATAASTSIVSAAPFPRSIAPAASAAAPEPSRSTGWTAANIPSNGQQQQRLIQAQQSQQDDAREAKRRRVVDGDNTNVTYVTSDIPTAAAQDQHSPVHKRSSIPQTTTAIKTASPSANTTTTAEAQAGAASPVQTRHQLPSPDMAPMASGHAVGRRSPDKPPMTAPASHRSPVSPASQESTSLRTEEDSDDSSGDEADIPAKLPAEVLFSLSAPSTGSVG